MIDSYFANLTITTILIFLLVFLALLLMTVKSKNRIELDRLLNEALTSALVPTGVALLICAFQPSYVKKLEGLQLNLAIAGVVVLFVAVNSTIRSMKAVKVKGGA